MDNDKKTLVAIFLGLVTIQLIIFYYVIHIYYESNYIDSKLDVIHSDVLGNEMLNTNITRLTKTVGIYYGGIRDKYYCVNIGERSPERIEETEAHEYCHYLIDVDSDNHFCGVES